MKHDHTNTKRYTLPQTHSLCRLFMSAGLALAFIFANGCASTPNTSGASKHPKRDLHLKNKTSLTIGASNSQHTPTVPVQKGQSAQAKSAQSDFDNAINFMQNNQLAEAESLLTKLTKKYPRLSGPWLNLGLIHLKKTQFESAKKAVKRAVQANPQNPYAFNALGIVFRELGDFPAALKAYQSALALDNKYDQAHLNYGILSDLYLHDLNTAVKHYKIYQDLQKTPDRAVKGWIKDLDRRIKKQK